MSAGRLMTAALLLVVATAGRASADWKLSDSVFPPEAPTQVTVGLGLDFNRGRFETEQTSKTASLTPLIRFESDNVAVRASLPLFRLEGPLEAGLDPPKGTEYGVGDLNMEIGYTVYPLIEGTPFFDFICRVKFPTADKDFGTGEFDVTLLTSAVQTIYRDFSAFADLGVRLRGGGAY
ncbi:MAG: hypothetical protein GY944_29790, partial [bacterium]|nr:hypothetical protein [bacterium]